jgi:hypothetical protein
MRIPAALLIAALLSSTAATCLAPVSAARAESAPATATSAAAVVATGSTTANALLAGLPEAVPTGAAYDRDLFVHWVDEDGDGCDTRQEVLAAESVAAPVAVGACPVVSGQWYSWYDGATWTNPSDVDIDHFVPLGEAWRSGADSWTADQRRSYANDLGDDLSLVATTNSVNSAKGDKDPASWLPPLTPVRCQYATDWVLVKSRWSLGVDVTERSALTALLDGGCGDAAIATPVVALAPTSAPPATPVSSPVYRFWSPTFQGHFFTMSAAERDSIRALYPSGIWSYEGERYQAFATQQPGTVPLYRFWSATFNGHFYTTNEAEKDSVIALYDDFTWAYEMIAYYVYPVDSTVPNTSAVARFWSQTYQHHFYTANADEAAGVKRYPAAIWNYENDNFRVPTTINPVEPVVTPPVVAPPVVTRPSNPGDTKNCDSFSTWAQANAWFQTYLPFYGDIAQLDNDHDNIPCETLRGAP